MEVQAVGVIAGHVSDVEGAVLGGAIRRLDDGLVQREAVDCLSYFEITRIASDASRSFEKVM